MDRDLNDVVYRFAVTGGGYESPMGDSLARGAVECSDAGRLHNQYRVWTSITADLNTQNDKSLAASA